MDTTQTAERILARAEAVYRALHAGHDDVALRQARDLRSTLDGMITALTFSTITDGRMTEVQHG